MNEVARGSGEDENVSGRLPKTALEADALRPVIADLLRSIPLKWAEFDLDQLTHLQGSALFLMTAAGIVEQRGWIRTTIANHSTCFELRFQATGEHGFAQAMERATAVEFETWGDAWRKWIGEATRDRSPFHTEIIKPQEWRLTDQGELARDELSGSGPITVYDFVLKRGFFGPGYWMRRAMAGRPLAADEQRQVQNQLDAGLDLARLSRPAVPGEGQLLEIRKIEQPAAPQPVNLTNWSEGASAFASAFGQMLGPMFESMAKSGQASTTAETAPSTDLQQADAERPREVRPYQNGEMVVEKDRVTLCGVDICSGSRPETRRKLLELLSQQRSDGSFVPYGGQEIAAAVGIADTSVAGVVRDLRKRITEVLLEEARIDCGLDDVILSGGPGYRLSPTVTVRDETRPSPTAATADSVPDDPDQHDPDDPYSNVPDDPDAPDPSNEASDARQSWILKQLADGCTLRAPDVVLRFDCSEKTAKRDLQSLREQGRIEFVGNTRTGSYRLKPPKLGG